MNEQQSRGSVEQYCHLRQKPDLSKRMADEMDINLEVFNLETDFFGDLGLFRVGELSYVGDVGEGRESEIKALRKAIGGGGKEIGRD